MNPQIDYRVKPVRASSVLTTAYVAGAIHDCVQYNQLILLWAVTLGNLTSSELIVEFSDDNGTTWYQESYAVTNVAGNAAVETDTPLSHTVAADGKYRLAINIADHKVRVSVKGTGDVTNSLVKVDAVLVKNYA